jgi:hypothetical protein
MSANGVWPPISSCVAFPLIEGELTCGVIRQVASGPLGLQLLHIAYPEGSNAVPAQPGPICRLENVLALPLWEALTAGGVAPLAGEIAEPPQPN